MEREKVELIQAILSSLQEKHKCNHYTLLIDFNLDRSGSLIGFSYMVVNRCSNETVKRDDNEDESGFYAVFSKNGDSFIKLVQHFWQTVFAMQRKYKDLYVVHANTNAMNILVQFRHLAKVESYDEAVRFCDYSVSEANVLKHKEYAMDAERILKEIQEHIPSNTPENACTALGKFLFFTIYGKGMKFLRMQRLVSEKSSEE